MTGTASILVIEDLLDRGENILALARPNSDSSSLEEPFASSPELAKETS